ncbi:helix-turn-helix transcriptional regulator [Actinosynnema sp. NPDC023658]|uniref:helix-turn-helix domain-containing protein n=1 Tax=Actinosynnema sp. NPDC023658 TaxID=3155465 RepID=UPI0033E37327
MTRAELLSVIQGVRFNRDRVVVSVPRTSHLLDADNPYDALSSREREVLALVGMALSNRQIGVRLRITEGTVKRHLRNIFRKLGATSRMDAANKAAAWSAPARPAIPTSPPPTTHPWRLSGRR